MTIQKRHQPCAVWKLGINCAGICASVMRRPWMSRLLSGRDDGLYYFIVRHSMSLVLGRKPPDRGPSSGVEIACQVGLCKTEISTGKYILHK